MESFNKTIVEVLPHDVSDNPGEWHLQTNTLTYVYKTQMHHASNYIPFRIILPNPPQPLAVKSTERARNDITATQ